MAGLPELRPNLRQNRRAFSPHGIEGCRVQTQSFQDRWRDLCGRSAVEDCLWLETWMRHQQHDIGVVMCKATVISDHRRASGVGYAYIRSHNDVWCPRILPRFPTTNVVIQRQGRPEVDLPEANRCCVLFKQLHGRGNTLALIQPEY